VRRYSVAIVGGGYRGLLVSDRTRIPGLLSVSDLAATVEALERGDTPPVTWRGSDDADEELEELDRRLTEAHDARNSANVVLVLSLLGLTALALARRSALLGRAAVLAAPAALLAALLLSWFDYPSPVLLALLTLAGALAAARLPLGPVLAAFLVVYGAVLLLWPEVNSLAIIGPHPDGGGRFFGVTNQVGTLLVVPALLGTALLAPFGALPVAFIAIAVVGWSQIGADGGGAVVLAAGFLVLLFRMRELALTPRRLALVAAGALAVGLAVVTVDALTGGSSHVTRSIGSGPGDLAGDIGHRLRVSFDGATSSWHAVLLVLVGITALVWLARRERRSAVLDAALIALGVSLLVNDTPTDVAAFGALSCAALYVWERVRRVE
jgi:hypothetical protein